MAKNNLAAPANKPPIVPQVPKPTPPMDKQWSCKTELPKDAELTVGVPFTMQCEGESLNLSGKDLKIVNRDDVKFSLHLLEVKSLTDNSAELVVTPWMAGELSIPNPALTDGKLRIGLGDQKLNVTSVLDAATNPEMKPFPPLMPISIVWPIWLWLVAAAIAAVGVGVFGLAMRRSIRRKRFLASLEKNATSLSPFNHFNKELRRLVRTIPSDRARAWPKEEASIFFVSLDSDFRWFLARELLIPVVEMSPRAIVNEIKRADRKIWERHRRELRVVLLELATSKRDAVGIDDATQLSELCRVLADKIVKEREG